MPTELFIKFIFKHCPSHTSFESLKCVPSVSFMSLHFIHTTHSCCLRSFSSQYTLSFFSDSFHFRDMKILQKKIYHFCGHISAFSSINAQSHICMQYLILSKDCLQLSSHMKFLLSSNPESHHKSLSSTYFQKPQIHRNLIHFQPRVFGFVLDLL